MHPIMDEIRFARVAEAIREEVSELISYEMTDPRVADVQVTEVLFSPDLRKARIRLNMLDPAAEAGALAALDGAKGYLRKQLALNLQLRAVPDLSFESDKEVASPKVASLLKRIQKGRPRPDAENPEPEKTES